jgi:hypothetical protein
MLGLAPALAEREYFVPRPQNEIRALEIQLQIRIEPEKTLWYRIDVVEGAIPRRADRHPHPAVAAVTGDPAGSEADTSPTQQIKDGVVVVRTIRAAAFALVKHLLTAVTTSSEGQ